VNRRRQVGVTPAEYRRRYELAEARVILSLVWQLGLQARQCLPG
jgi:AraC-like DNA-binding protein